MIDRKGIEVYVKPVDRDQPYEEYSLPGQLDRARWIERYIEAEPGKKFEVVVKVLPHFVWHDKQLALKLDCESNGIRQYLNKSSADQGRNGSVESVFKTIYTRRGTRDSQLSRGFLTFGALVLDEEADLSKQESKENAEKLGFLSVVITHGRQNKGHLSKRTASSCSKKYPSVGDHDMDDIRNTKKADKGLIKDFGIDRYVRPTELVHVNDNYHPFLKHKGAEPQTFVFHYRSEMSLSRLGIKITDQDSYGFPALGISPRYNLSQNPVTETENVSHISSTPTKPSSTQRVMTRTDYDVIDLLSDNEGGERPLESRQTSGRSPRVKKENQDYTIGNAVKQEDSEDEESIQNRLREIRNKKRQLELEAVEIELERKLRKRKRS